MRDNGQTYRMTDAELLEFVRSFVRGEVFSSAHISSADHNVLPLVFIPLGLGALTDHPNPAEIGIVWEFLSASGPRAINGYPTFTSVRVMHTDDWERARKAIVRANNELQNVTLD